MLELGQSSLFQMPDVKMLLKPTVQKNAKGNGLRVSEVKVLIV